MSQSSLEVLLPFRHVLLWGTNAEVECQVSIPSTCTNDGVLIPPGRCVNLASTYTMYLAQFDLSLSVLFLHAETGLVVQSQTRRDRCYTHSTMKWRNLLVL